MLSYSSLRGGVGSSSHEDQENSLSEPLVPSDDEERPATFRRSAAICGVCVVVCLMLYGGYLDGLHSWLKDAQSDGRSEKARLPDVFFGGPLILVIVLGVCLFKSATRVCPKARLQVVLGVPVPLDREGLTTSVPAQGLNCP